MRFAAAVALTACVLAAPASAALPPLTRVQVTAKEFYFSLSRQSVKAGPAIIELVNFGEDPHDLRLQRVGGAHIAGTPQVQPGQYYDLKVTLLPETKYNASGAASWRTTARSGCRRR